MGKNKFDSVMGLVLGSIILVPFNCKPVLIALFLCYALFFFIKRKEKFSITAQKETGLICMLFVPFIVSIFYSYNVERGITYLIRCLPLLIIPLSFAFLQPENKRAIIRSFVPAFVVTNALYIVLMLLYILQLGYLRSEHNLYYYYSFITYEFYNIGDHPIYLSVQFAMALFLLIQNNFFNKIKKAILFVVLFFGLFFLARKGVILSFIIILPLYLSTIVKSKRVLIGSLLVVIVSFLAFMFVPEIKNRYAELWSKEGYVKNEVTSTGIRLVLWENSLELIKESPVFGYGIGDNQELFALQMESKGYFILAQKKTNCHNQYLQFLLSIGVIGLSFFVLSILWLFSFFYMNKAYLGLAVVLFFLMVFVSESFLERQNGIITYALFISLLVFCVEDFIKERR
jgi:O-antigen ligase